MRALRTAGGSAGGLTTRWRRFQRLLHRRLVEMAGFVDARFGVYARSDRADDAHDSVGALLGVAALQTSLLTCG